MSYDDDLKAEIVGVVEELVDVTISRHYSSTADETFEECHVCGEWEGHKADCFVPALLKWLKEAR